MQSRYITMEGHAFWAEVGPFFSFCRVLGISIKHFKVKFNISIYWYVDDKFVVGPSKELTVSHTRIVVKELMLAGFFSKSN